MDLEFAADELGADDLESLRSSGTSIASAIGVSFLRLA
jgi:hypothetical protein